MQIRSVTHNNRKKLFEVGTSTKTLVFPFSKAAPTPTTEDPVTELSVDPEAGREAFTYVLHSGRTGTVHVEQVLEYNQDPTCLRDLLLYRLTLEARKRVAASPLSKREIVRRPGHPTAASDKAQRSAAQRAGPHDAIEPIAMTGPVASSTTGTPSS